MQTRVERGQQVESTHDACAAVHTRDGQVRHWGREATSSGAFLRSMAKPFQSLALLEAGVGDAFQITPEELAVTTASHAGESYHHQLVSNYLSRNGLDESFLQCAVHAPFSKTERLRRLAAGEQLSVLGNNCSGKHTGMLLFAQHLGAPLESYLELDHPVQRANREVLERFMGGSFSEDEIAVDGCGVPTFYATLERMALGFHRLSDANWLQKQGLDRSVAQIHAALRAHPRAFSGEARLPERMRPFLEPVGLFSKEGAEGGIAIWGDPGALVMKSLDGQERGIRWLIPCLLEELGWIERAAAEAWLNSDPPVVKNVAGRVVGRIDTVVREFKLR